MSRWRQNFYDFDDFDDFDENDDFKRITYIGDPKEVNTASKLRHYINCHGIDKDLQKYLGLTYGEIENLYSIVSGSMPIKANMKKLYEQYKIDYRNREDAREKAELKNIQLEQILVDKRQTMCGIGTRKLKLFLNKKIKAGDEFAEAIRLIFEIEDVNIQAKHVYPYYKNKVYAKKEALLQKLIDLCINKNYIFGWQNTDNYSTNTLLYFELPGAEQISFHTNLKIDKNKVPHYDKEWDGLENSTLNKIERAILNRYSELQK